MRQGTAASIAIAVGMAAWGLGAWSARPPGSADREVDARLSLDRLERHIDVLAAEPRPVGTAAHSAAREYIIAELQALGLEVDLQPATIAVQRRGGDVVAGRITNVVARLRHRGRGPAPQAGGAVGLLAHYDSRPNTPGAADNATGVATVLETLRVLASAADARRDVIAIFTDAEEAGLLGARAFTARHRWADDLVCLLNVEARGRTGPSIMFETTPDNAALAAMYARAVPFPFATSLSAEVYRRMPNDTDFTLFKDRPVAGFNFAFIGGFPAYHTALDSRAGLDVRSVRHQGLNVAALALHLATVEQLPGRGGGDAVFFTLPGWRMVVYPASTAPRLAVATLLLAAAALWRSRRTAWTPGGLTRGVGVALLAPVGCFVVGSVVWELLALVPSGALDGPHRRPHEPSWFVGTAALLAVLLVSVVARWLIRERRSLDVLAGVQLVWSLAALGVAWTAPGASYLLTWPAAGAWVAWWLVARAGGARSEAAAQLVTGASVVPAAVFFAQLTTQLLDALTLSGLPVAAALFGLLLTMLAPQLAVAGASKRLLQVLPLVAIALMACGLARSGPTVERPHVDTLFYVVDGAEQWWYSLDRKVDEWTRESLGGDPDRLEAPAALFLNGRTVVRTRSSEIPLGRPSIDLLAAGEDSGKHRKSIGIELRPGIGGQVLHLRLASPALEGVRIDDQRFEVDGAAAIRLTLIGEAGQEWRLAVDLEAGGESAGSLEVDLLEQRYGFPEGTTVTSRPPWLIPSSSWRTDATYAVARARVPDMLSSEE